MEEEDKEVVADVEKEFFSRQLRRERMISQREMNPRILSPLMNHPLGSLQAVKGAKGSTASVDPGRVEAVREARSDVAVRQRTLQRMNRRPRQGAHWCMQGSRDSKVLSLRGGDEYCITIKWR